MRGQHSGVVTNQISDKKRKKEKDLIVVLANFHGLNNSHQWKIL